MFSTRDDLFAGPHVCLVCGYVYEPDDGDATQDVLPGTPFHKLPDDWICPLCFATKAEFEPVE